MSVEYNDYLNEHIANVAKGLQWMLDNLHLNSEETKAINAALLTSHDQSKYDKEEYEAYDAFFYGNDRSYVVCRNFDRAWLHHIHKNPHHWQYWVLLEDDPETGVPYKALPIPLNFIFEMIADWWTFSWKNNNLFEIFVWYGEHRHKQYINPASRMIIEDILKKMWNILALTEVRRGKERDELEKQYISYWIEEPVNKELSWNHSSKSIGKVTDTHETESGLAIVVKHSDTEDDEDLYGVPELKKFPMPDKKHVKSAIRFFNYVDPKYEKELAEAILSRMKEYGMVLGEDISVGDQNRFKKYIPKEEKNNE